MRRPENALLQHGSKKKDREQKYEGQGVPARVQSVRQEQGQQKRTDHKQQNSYLTPLCFLAMSH